MPRYYYSGMKKNEVILFKQWDSDTTLKGRLTFHTAFSDPNAPADAPTRQSIEVRAIAFFPGRQPYHIIKGCKKEQVRKCFGFLYS